MEPPFGLVRTGMLADLVIVPENPLANFKTLYGTGHQRLNPQTDQLERVGGVRWTIKDGIVYDAPRLLAEVARNGRRCKGCETRVGRALRLAAGSPKAALWPRQSSLTKTLGWSRAKAGCSATSTSTSARATAWH